MYQYIDVEWNNSRYSDPLNVRGSFQYILLTDIEFDCYLHLGSSPGEIFGLIRKGDIGEIRLPTDQVESVILEAINPNKNDQAGNYTGIYAQLYLATTPIRFSVIHRRPPIFGEENQDSNNFPYAFWRITDDTPVVVTASGLAGMFPGEVIADHETNMFIARHGSLSLSGNLKTWNVAAIAPYGLNSVSQNPVLLADEHGVQVAVTNTVPVSGSVGITGKPPVDASGSSVSVTSLPAVAEISTVFPTRNVNSFMAGFRNFGNPPVELTTTLAAGNNFLAAIYHDATSTKALKVQRIRVAVLSVSAAAEIYFELRKINTNPTGGTAVTTQKTGGRYTNGYSLNAESVAMISPTGLAVANSIAYDFVAYNLGITGSAPTTNPPSPVQWVDLFNADWSRGDVPTIDAGAIGGWAISCNSAGANTLKWIADIHWTEE